MTEAAMEICSTHLIHQPGGIGVSAKYRLTSQAVVALRCCLSSLCKSPSKRGTHPFSLIQFLPLQNQEEGCFFSSSFFFFLCVFACVREHLRKGLSIKASELPHLPYLEARLAGHSATPTPVYVCASCGSRL